MRYIIYHYDEFNVRYIILKNNSTKIINFVDTAINIPKTDKDVLLEKSISRSKRVIREYALCNDFEWFCTFTISSKYADRLSLQSCEDNIRRRLKSYKQYHKDFKYVLIPEKHEKGGFHFHRFNGRY